MKVPPGDGGLRVAPRRLVVTGTVLVDILMYLDQFPAAGGAANASRTIVAAGAGFNLLAAAARLGLPAAYAGLVGDGPFGAVVRDALAAIGVPVLFPPRLGQDTGFAVGLVETGAGTEPTFFGSPGAESALSAADLRDLHVTPGDAIYVSGYDLWYPAAGAALADWLPALGPECLLVFDPGPLAGQLEAANLDVVAGRADIVSLNLSEATALARRHEPAAPATRREPAAPATGQDPAALASALSRRIRHDGWVVLRAGDDGCWIARAGSAAQHIPARPTTLVDPTGAGDAHVAAMLARLAAGQDVAHAARWANVAASLSVEQAGPSTSPTAARLTRAMTQAASEPRD